MKGILWQKQSNTHTLNWQFKSESRARLGTLGKRVARSSWDIGKRVARSSWGIGKRVARSSWGFPKQPTARSNDTLPRSWQATFWSCIKHCMEPLHCNIAQIKQTHHIFVGEIRIFSVKIRINPYPSFMHRCSENARARFISVYNKIAILCSTNRQPAAKNQNRSFTSRGATVGLGLRFWLTRSIVLHGGRNLPFFGNLAEKASCVDDQTVLFRYT